MNPLDRRLQLDLAAARYLDAMERDDFAAMAEMWRAASDDHQLAAVFREIHAGLLEERAHAELAAVAEGITTAVENHLPSAESLTGVMTTRLVALLRSVPLSLAAVLAVLGALLAWAYWPTLAAMADKWQNDPQYSHGYLVPLFSLALLWLRRDRLQSVQQQYNWWGVALLTGGALLHFAGAYVYLDWLEATALIPFLAGVCVLLGGWSALRWAWPALAFLMFMMPLPHRVETALGLPLRRIATISSTYALQTLGVPSLAEGNTIWLQSGPIDVVEACSGLSMLMIFFALATAVAVVIRRPLLDRLALVASAVPIAIAANVVRISATGVVQVLISRDLALRLFHDWAGWLMMPLALALLWGELWLLSHLLVESKAVRPAAVPLPKPH